MTSKEIRGLSIEQIEIKVIEYKEELFNLRFQNATGQLANPSRIKEVRKTIAKLKTIANEKQK